MNRVDIRELHYIAPIANVPSIMELGILSHNRAKRLDHCSIAMEKIQVRRTEKSIPGANRNLHDFVNLYFDAHNPMLSKLREHNSEICVLRIDADVLDLPGAIVSDRNASSDYANFHPAIAGLEALDKERLFAQYWTHPGNPFEEMRHKSEKCAEVLVPDSIAAEFIIGAYLSHSEVLRRWRLLDIHLAAEVKHGYFF